MRRFLAIGVVALFCTSTNASAQAVPSLCGDRADIVRSLTEQLSEAPRAIGVIDKSAILEIFVGPEDTWTIIATGTDGKSCLVTSGEGWQSLSLIVGVES